MKIRKKLVFGITLSLFLFATTVYAATSSDYLTKAQNYIDDNCAKAKISNQISLNCYLFYKIAELETKVDSNTSRIIVLENAPSPAPIPSPSPLGQKELKTFDNNGNELGLFISRSSFLYVSLGRIVVLVDAQIGTTRDDVWYQSSDCTGTAYTAFSERDYWSKVNEIYTAGPGKYYTVDRDSGSTVALNSLQRYSGGAFPCLSATTSGPAWSLTPITLPFSEPIALPLQYKYE